MDRRSDQTLPLILQSDIIATFTANFYTLFKDNKSPTQDRMVQIAEVCKQKVADGCLEGTVEGKLKLFTAARDGLVNLLTVYQTYLRHHKLTIWQSTSPEANEVRNLVYNRIKSYDNYKSYLTTPIPAANAVICLIHQTTRLLDQQLHWLAAETVI